MPTSSGSHARPSRPPRRYPESELPTQGASSAPRDLPDEAEGGVDGELVSNPLVENSVTGPASSLPRQEEPPMSPLLPPIASLEEVLQAQIRELDHDLREAFSRLADADLRISQMEAESTRLRDIEATAAKALSQCAAVEARLAAVERLIPDLYTEKKTTIEVAEVGDPIKRYVRASNLPRESVDPSGQRGKVRSDKRDKICRETGEHSLTSSDQDDGYSSSEDSFPLTGKRRYKGKSVPGLEEVIPARSDYKPLVSYRTYRLVNRSDRYDAAVTGKLSAYLKRLKHAIPPDDRFSGDDPIEILGFLRTFKESADHNEVGEGAAARLIPYFLTGTAKEGYRAQLDEVPPGMPAYPYMVQYLLETYALDDELAKAYMAVTTAKQAEGEGERAFGRRLHRLAIKAGNVVAKRDLKTIYVEGLPPFVQSGLRMHLTPDMTFEHVQRLAHNLGISLRQTIQQSSQPTPKVTPPKYPSGVKAFLPRSGSVHTVDSETEGMDERPCSAYQASLEEVEVAIASARAGLSPPQPRVNQYSWPTSTSRSPSPSVVSIPTRGWNSPAGSVTSDHQTRSGPTLSPKWNPSRPPLCFLCYVHGHFLAECPRLPETLQREAVENRAAYERNRNPEGTRSLPPRRPQPPRSHNQPVPPPSAREVWPSPTLAAHAVAEPIAEEHEEAESDQTPGDGSENSVGGK
jgi:hypothetical protein